MKKIVLWIGILLFVVSCSTQKKLTEKKAKPVEIETNDSTQYELETFDQKFETWYEIQNSPASYRTEAYYESWNRLYVAAWNAKALNPSRNSFFQPIIGWDPTADYGFKLNHKLFYYFQYVEHVLHIPILPGGSGPHIVFTDVRPPKYVLGNHCYANLFRKTNFAMACIRKCTSVPEIYLEQVMLKSIE